MSCSYKRPLAPASMALALSLSWPADAVVAEQPLMGQTAAATSSVKTSNVPAVPDWSKVADGHALVPVIDFARKEQEYLRDTVRDFTCRLTKRERIHGILQDYNYIDMWVREEQRNERGLATPLSIYMQFLAPKNVAGRRVLFVDGRNDNKLLVRNGGKHFDYVVVEIDPHGETAMDESLVPVTQSGFNQILAQMIAVLERHVAVDPSGRNTEVQQINGAKLNERPCSVIRITHPTTQPGLEFHRANVFVDDALHVPVRVDYTDWPRKPGGEAPLIAEYTYSELQVNVGLPDSVFNPHRLRGAAAK
ncbi:MAG: DUF1571 domain-containing protein [Pirellulales bacterium]